MKTNIIVKTDANIKRKAKRLAEEVGLTLSDVVNVSLHEFVKTGTLTISRAVLPKKLAEWKKIRDEYAGGIGVTSFDNVEDLIKDLDLA